jgi:NADPH:quinone reductase-like Zn-dependent oxidoreductase
MLRTECSHESASVGQYAIQIAAIFGFKIVTTCSPHSFDLVRSLGASHVFDYNDSDVVKSIKDTAPGLRYVFDTIGNKMSSTTASQAIDETGGTLTTVRPDKSLTENVTKQTKVTPVLVWTAFNRVIQYKKAQFPVSASIILMAVTDSIIGKRRRSQARCRIQ